MASRAISRFRRTPPEPPVECEITIYPDVRDGTLGWAWKLQFGESRYRGFNVDRDKAITEAKSKAAQLQKRQEWLSQPSETITPSK